MVLGVNVDLLGPICLTQALLKRMVARKTGQIVMISSLAGKVGSPLRTAYCAAKHGLIGYADALRIEVAGHGISVIGVTPGSIRTDVSRNAMTADGSTRGVSDEAIETGIDPDIFAELMLTAIDEGQREVAIAEHGMEKWIAEVRRTPEEMFDKMIENFHSGYAARMGVSEQ